jgi:hypothetical protein
MAYHHHLAGRQNHHVLQWQFMTYKKPMKAKIAPASKHRAVRSSPSMKGSKLFSSILIETIGLNLFKLISLRL